MLSFGLSGLNSELILRAYGFSINSKILFMSSGDKPVLTKSQSKVFADFDILQILTLKFTIRPKLFRVNSLLSSWVLRILNLYWNFKTLCHCNLLLIFQFYSIEFLNSCKALGKRYKNSKGIKFPKVPSNSPKKLINILCCPQHKGQNCFQAEGTKL